MGVIVPVGFYQCTPVFSVTGSIKQFTIGIGVVDLEGGIDAPSVVAPKVVTALTTGTGSGTYGPFRADNMSVGWRFERLQCDLMTETGVLTHIQSVGISGTAVTAGQIPIVNSAVLITKNTPLGGRKNRGRMYSPIVFPTEADISAAGVIGDSFVATLTTRWENFRARMGTENLGTCLFHSDGSAPTVITGYVASPLVATQRRRLR